MFMNYSKTISKFGKPKLGAGLKKTKKNSTYYLIMKIFIWLIKTIWNFVVLLFWMVYVCCYFIFWCIRKIFQKIIK